MNIKYLKNNKTAIIAGIIILAAVIGIIVYFAGSQNRHSDFQDVTVEDINNASYKVWGETVKFTDGKYQSTDPHDLLNSTIDFSAIGDINGDGARDALVVTTTSRADSIDELHVLLKFGSVLASKPLDIPLPKGE